MRRHVRSHLYRQRQLMLGLCTEMRPNDHQGEEGENEVKAGPWVIGEHKLIPCQCQNHRNEHSNWWHHRNIFDS